MPSVRPPEPALPPERIGPYRLLRPISQGGMARVFEGRFDSLAGVSTRVAVKVIHPDFASEGAFQELFIQEARISARLEHLNVVRVQQFNREGHHYYLVMEYIDGVTFRKIVTACRKHSLRLPPALLAELGRQACEGLHYAHTLRDDRGEALRLVHRDMKPSNLMLNVQGVVKVLDFGISYAHGQEESKGAVKGTWGYMAPEQAEGEPVGAAADLFGLASVLYEVASLDPLFSESDSGVIRKLLVADEGARRAATLGGAYSEIAKVLVRALQRDPSARYRSAEAMGRALGLLVADPMSARDDLVRFIAELRRLESPGAVPVGDKAASAASVSTMQSPGLPVVTGSLHKPDRPARTAAAPRKKPGISAGTVFSLVFALFSVGVLGFSAWVIFAPRGSAPAAEVSPAVAAPGKPPVAAPGAANPGADAASQGPGSPSVVPEPTPGSAPTPAPIPSPASVAAAPAEPTGKGVAPSGSPGTTSHGRSGGPAPTPDTPADPAPASLVAGLRADTEASPAADADADGLLTVSASPRAQVMVDGEYVRYTPVFQHSVPAGPHTVLLVAADGRRKTFKVDVAAGEEVRRVWLFDEERWSNEAAAPP